MVVISAILGILNRKLHVAPSSLLMIVLTISDIMTLNFFYLVRDEGSWLDIGESISHFCICNLLILFIIALEQLSEVIPELSRLTLGDYYWSSCICARTRIEVGLIDRVYK